VAPGLAATTLANKWLDMLAGTAFTAPATFAVQLHTANPAAAGTTAVSAGDNTRKTVTWSAASAGSKSMSSMSGSWTNAGTSETLTHISGWDNATAGAGNFLLSAALGSSQAWATANTFALTTLTVALTPIAA
jgi:hypothetical protein